MTEGHFCEKLIKRKAPAGYGILLLAGCLLSAAAWIGSLFYLPLLLAAVLFTGATIWHWRRGSVEFEYSWVGDELRIERIRARSRRKRMDTLEADGVRLVAPLSSPLLSSFESRSMTVSDYTSRTGKDGVYALLYEKAGSSKKVLWEPGEKMLKTMKMTMPRKINL